MHISMSFSKYLNEIIFIEKNPNTYKVPEGEWLWLVEFCRLNVTAGTRCPAQSLIIPDGDALQCDHVSSNQIV